MFRILFQDFHHSELQFKMDNHFFPVSSISLMLLYLCHSINFTVCFDDPSYLTGDVSIYCGSIGSSAAHNGRQWLGDAHPRFASSVQITGKSTISSVARGSVSADRVPYKTARISRSGFSYIFLVNPGEKLIRLHFNPTPYKGFQKLKDLFTVETGPFTLLSNFSASLTADALGLSSVIKEFCINVEENRPLHIVFTPESSQSEDTFAFLNGIEIITVPLGHYYFHEDGDIGAQVVGRKAQQIYIDNSTALEMVRRVNIKQDGDDSSDMFAMWATLPRVKANQFNNMTWKIPVDVGFRYLIRFHFSDLGLNFVQETRSMNFEILVNEVTAYNNIDLVSERDTNKFIMYKDYIVMLKGRKEGVKRDILVSLQSYSKFIDGYGPFTGFEILKLSNLENSLACPNPLPPARNLPSSGIHTLHAALDHRNIIVTISITVIALANIIVHKVREILEASYTEDEHKPSSRAERFCRRFSLAEMQLATRNFDDHLIIGKGGFGKVYKGLIDRGKEAVAIKRLKASSSQGAHEFLAEIETLSELRHINLVSLIGYCNEQREMILVYEYMAGGTLGDHLYKLARKGNSCASLTWKQCLNICIGAGRGLDYLHTGHGVIHRDVKVSNILLDEIFMPKVSDFGLVKHENLTNLQSHVSTKVKGTFGYLDPTYFSTGKLTRKSDTYSFGVVLLEVLCGRPALDHRVPEAEQILTKWARDKIREGEVELIVASNLKKEISPNSLKAFVEIVERCLDDEPKKRPTMAQVVLHLEFSLEQQDIVESSVPKEIMIDAPISTDAHTPTSPPKELTNNQIDNDDLSYRRKGRKVSFWDALLNKVKPSRGNENSISEYRSTSKAFSASVPPTPRSDSANLKSFTFSDLKAATRNFRPDSVLGDGSFGSVFKGWIDKQSLVASKPGSGMAIAVKRMNQEGWQGHKEWLAEINYLGQLRHPNLVKLIGYCLEDEERLLVYEFMPKGSLEKHLFHRGPLSWSIRMKIALDAARVLVFLHGAETKVVYRDFKTSNILLDSNYNAKLYDFGLARVGPTGDESHVTTQVSGTNGYADPEYIATGHLTAKSDVYSFGVVLLEILSGKKAIDKNRPSVEQHLVDWAKPHLTNKRRIFRVIDTHLKGQYSLGQAMKAANLALECLSADARSRPNMDNVVAVLEQLKDNDTSKNEQRDNRL